MFTIQENKENSNGKQPEKNLRKPKFKKLTVVIAVLDIEMHFLFFFFPPQMGPIKLKLRSTGFH